ncbi:MAG: hypothetical protein GY929_14075 [Actinomycetia bacterium]|nr:hypothetical protein [Actinomycetes bacterium]
MTLVERIVALHRALASADIPHAFGGALALAWCTQRARATIDIDVNLFVPSADAERVWAALPNDVVVTDDDRRAIEADGQTRLWWEKTPIDVFFNTTAFHDGLGGRARLEAFGGADVPFLACRDLAVFKAFFDRTKDWADLEEMAAADSLDVEAVLGVLALYLGGSDPRIERLRQLGTEREK